MMNLFGDEVLLATESIERVLGEEGRRVWNLLPIELRICTLGLVSRGLLHGYEVGEQLEKMGERTASDWDAATIEIRWR